MLEFGQNRALSAVLRKRKKTAGDKSSPEPEPPKEDGRKRASQSMGGSGGVMQLQGTLASFSRVGGYHPSTGSQ
jgi:hypothetical protein